MTRKFLNTVRTDVNSQIVDNITGDITADILRPIIIDAIDSLTDDEAGLSLSAPNAAFPIGSTWTNLPVDVVIGGDASFLIVDSGAGTITTTLTAGFSYGATGSLTCIAINNEVIELAIGINGVDSGFTGALTGRGGSREYSTFADSLVLSSVASSVYTLMARAVAPTTIDLRDAVLVVRIKPTNNPT